MITEAKIEGAIPPSRNRGGLSRDWPCPTCGVPAGTPCSGRPRAHTARARLREAWQERNRAIHQKQRERRERWERWAYGVGNEYSEWRGGHLGACPDPEQPEELWPDCDSWLRCIRSVWFCRVEKTEKGWRWVVFDGYRGGEYDEACGWSKSLDRAMQRAIESALEADERDKCASKSTIRPPLDK